MLGTALLGGCVSADFADGQFLCDPSAGSDACPPGQVCAADGRCRSSQIAQGGSGTGGSASGGSGGSGAAPTGGGGTGGCVPYACTDLFPDCGTSLSDGCEGTLDCSEACPPPSTCGGGGVPDQCSCEGVVLSQARSAGDVTTQDVNPNYDNPWITSAASLQADDGNVTATQDALPDGRSSDFLAPRLFGFSIPADATILGIELRIVRSQGSGGGGIIRDQSIKLRELSGPIQDQQASPDDWPVANDALQSYGGAQDLWGEAWTPARVNDSGFGAWIQVQSVGPASTQATPRIDQVEVEIFYQPACP